MNKFFILFVLLIIGVMGKYPVIYEISTRPWLYELSQTYGKTISKLRDIPMSEFQYLKSQGVEYVWMMGVWSLGEYGLNLDKQVDYSGVLPDYTQDDIIGSPYAITEYVCNPEIGSDDDLFWLKNQLNSMGLKLMLDFVPNHSACDAPTVTSNMDYYVRAPSGQEGDSKKYLPNGVAHGKDPWFDPWADTAQWNYFNPDTRAFQTANLKKVASLADGIRCDMAHLDLNDVFAGTWNTELSAWGYTKPSTEFWTDAITEVKGSYPNVIFMAEVYDYNQQMKLVECGFDYFYDKSLLDAFVSKGTAAKDYIAGKNLDYFMHAAHFVENHDENRAAASLGGNDIANAAGTIAAFLPGLVFFNHGQWQGYKNKLDVHLRRAASESVNQITVNYYKQVCSILQLQAMTNDALDNYYYVYNVGGNDASKFVAWIRKGNTKELIVVNYSSSDTCANVPIHDVTSSEIKELFSGTTYTRDVDTMKTTGLTVCLSAWGAQVFEYQ